jgi:hypothetical protein
MTRSPAHARSTALATLLLCLCLLVAPRLARADSRTDFLVTRLHADDFRVRTNAALALGRSGDAGVVAPLCDALGDGNEVVRQAVAVALGRLAQPSAASCLQGRLAVEPSAAVKREISKALDASRPADTSSRVVANARYYVAISPIANQTTRADGEIAAVVGASVRDKLAELGGYQLAADGESPDQARALLAKRNLKGYYLTFRVEKFDYSSGNLRVRIKLAVFTYPGRDLRGEVPSGLTQTGVSPGDKGAEDNLLRMAAARAVELFAQNFP